MMNSRFWVRSFTILFLLMLSLPAVAQDATTELAATLEVLEPGVEVLRVNTSNWISINVEAIVGVGDRIRTDASGQARITYFADGVDAVLLPNTEYLIEQFEGSADQFNITAQVLLGQTLQRVERLLDINSTYDINMPGMSLTVRGTAFAVRVEETGRSSLVVRESIVAAEAENGVAEVPSGFGVRAAPDSALSEVVPATTFDELDAALDGCNATVQIAGDVRPNVRLGPGLNFPRVGTIEPTAITLFVGVSEAGDWYRVPFQGGLGWILATNVSLNSTCAGLRIFPDIQTEDVTAFEAIGEIITVEELQADLPVAEPATPDTDD